MKSILIITGSARPNSVNQAVVEMVAKNLEAQQAEVKIADLAELNLPYFNGAMPPSSDEYQPTDSSVTEFSKLVSQADGVVFVVPEYNHSISAITKNALDSLYQEWKDKPAAFVGYGWYAAKYSYQHFVDINQVIGLDLVEPHTGLQFNKDLNPDGSAKDEAAIEQSIDATLSQLLEKIK